MSEQLGRAAGTAKPETTPAVDLRKPWYVQDDKPNVIVDKFGYHVTDIPFSGDGSARTSVEAVQLARHIVACVNFCKDISTDLLELLGTDEYKVRISRVAFGEDASVTVSVEDLVRAEMRQRASALLSARSAELLNVALNGDGFPAPGGLL